MTLQSLMLLASTSLGVWACGDWTPPFTHAGSARIAHIGVRTATLEGACRMDGKRSYELSLHLHDVTQSELAADFAAATHDDAASSRSVTLGWHAQSQRVALQIKQEFEMPVADTARDRAAGLVLMAQAISQPDDAAAFFADLAAEPGEVTWAQSYGGDRIEARFAFSAADAVALRDAALACREGALEG